MIVISLSSCTKYVDVRTQKEVAVLEKSTLAEMAQCEFTREAKKNIGYVQVDAYAQNRRANRGADIIDISIKDMIFFWR
jgi:hypothetical protein